MLAVAAAVAASGCGRSRAATASAGTSRSGSWPTASECLDVPPKLSAQVRVFATGQGRKTDAIDAHSVALRVVRPRSLGCVGCWWRMTWSCCG